MTGDRGTCTECEESNPGPRVLHLEVKEDQVPNQPSLKTSQHHISQSFAKLSKLRDIMKDTVSKHISTLAAA